MIYTTERVRSSRVLNSLACLGSSHFLLSILRESKVKGNGFTVCFNERFIIECCSLSSSKSKLFASLSQTNTALLFLIIFYWSVISIQSKLLVIIVVKDVNFIFLVIGIQPCCNFLLLMLDSFFFCIQSWKIIYLWCSFQNFSGFGTTSIGFERKERSSIVETAAVRHLEGSVTKTEGFRFALVSFSAFLFI